MGNESEQEQKSSNSGVSGINGTNEINNKIKIVSSNGTSNNYVRRRRCNEKAQVCEKKRKRDTFRRVR